jgi:hypothetical protein
MRETSAHVQDSERRCDELVEWFLKEIAQGHMA